MTGVIWAFRLCVSTGVASLSYFVGLAEPIICRLNTECGSEDYLPGDIMFVPVLIGDNLAFKFLFGLLPNVSYMPGSV